MLAFVIILLLPTVAYAGTVSEEQYSEYLDSFDYSSFEELDDSTIKALDKLGISDFDYSKISSLSFSDFLDILKGMVTDNLQSPLSSGLIVMGFVILSSFVRNMSVGDGSMDELYSTVSALVISSILMLKLTSTFAICAGTLGAVGNFIYAFIPAFGVIVAASGGITTAFSTNSMLLLLAQGISFASNTVLLPISNCFLAIGICSSLKQDLNLDRLVKLLLKAITTCISFTNAVFVSILSIKTAVAARADILGIRSIRFAINTVVPVIGSSISEGLLSIQSYSSLIKSSVGIVGIVAISLLFLPAILQVVIWRFVITLCTVVSDVFGDKSVSAALYAFRSAMLIVNVILILTMVTTIISIGLLVAARTV